MARKPAPCCPNPATASATVAIPHRQPIPVPPLLLVPMSNPLRRSPVGTIANAKLYGGARREAGNAVVTGGAVGASAVRADRVRQAAKRAPQPTRGLARSTTKR